MPQSKEQDVTVNRLQVDVRLARVIDVMRAVATTAAVQTPAAIDIADAQDAAIARAFSRFEIGNSLAGVLSDLFATMEVNSRETAFAVDARLSNCQAVCKCEHHRSSLYESSERG